MTGFLKHIGGATNFNRLPKSERRLTFYSEGRNYWPHLEGIVRRILDDGDIPTCYLSSSADDPGLALSAPGYHAFYIGDGSVRDWVFRNIDTDAMVMTMPDLDQYQVKRSRHPVHYVYVQHSLVSLHMAYRKGAFDHFDSICCAGPHHVAEMQAMQKAHGLTEKNLVLHGYGRLDSIIERSRGIPKWAEISDVTHVLIAPSWGAEATIESGLAEIIVSDLLKMGIRTTLRPHPQTWKFAGTRLGQIRDRNAANPLFAMEDTVATQTSLHDSDLMISDWSGAALEYAFGLRKPVIFCDVPRKINNPDYEDIKLAPFEVDIRKDIGVILRKGQNIADCLPAAASKKRELAALNLSDYVFNPGASAPAAVEFIRSQLEKTR